MNVIVMSAVLLPVMAGMSGGTSRAFTPAPGLHSFSGALATSSLRFPITRTEADALQALPVSTAGSSEEMQQLQMLGYVEPD